MGDVGWETVQALLPLLKPSHQSHTLEEVLGSLESVLGPQVLSSVERRQKIVQVISGVADPNLLDEVASNPQGTSSVGALSTERLRQKSTGGSSPVVCARAARLLLSISHLCRDSASFETACHIMYVLSKYSQFDHLFEAEKLLESLVRVTSGSLRCGSNPDPLVYSVGALKNVTSTSLVRKALLELGAVTALARVLKDYTSVNMRGVDVAPVLLVQATGCLRNLASETSALSEFASCGVVPALMLTVRHFVGHSELMLNVARILSKISLHKVCGRQLDGSSPDAVSRKDISDLMRCVWTQYQHGAILERLCFVLSNLTTDMKSPAHRHNRQIIADALCGEEEGGDPCSGVEALLKILFTLSTDPLRNGPALVKVIRLIANLSIEDAIGRTVASSPLSIAALNILKHVSADEEEELVLNAVSLLHNLSYYADQQPNVVVESARDLLAILQPYILHDNPELVLESTRSIANLLRSGGISCEDAVSQDVHQATAILLDHPARELALAAAGLYCNLIACSTDNPALVSDILHHAVAHQVAPKLRDLIELAISLGDFGMLSGALKSLYNLCFAQDSRGVSGVSLLFGRDADSISTCLREALTFARDQNPQPPDTPQQHTQECIDVLQTLLDSIQALVPPESGNSSVYEELEWKEGGC